MTSERTTKSSLFVYMTLNFQSSMPCCLQEKGLLFSTLKAFPRLGFAETLIGVRMYSLTISSTFIARPLSETMCNNTRIGYGWWRWDSFIRIRIDWWLHRRHTSCTDQSMRATLSAPYCSGIVQESTLIARPFLHWIDVGRRDLLLSLFSLGIRLRWLIQLINICRGRIHVGDFRLSTHGAFLGDGKIQICTYWTWPFIVDQCRCCCRVRWIGFDVFVTMLNVIERSIVVVIINWIAHLRWRQKKYALETNSTLSNRVIYCFYRRRCYCCCCSRMNMESSPSNSSSRFQIEEQKRISRRPSCRFWCRLNKYLK